MLERSSDEAKSVTWFDRAMEHHRGLIIGATSLFLFAWRFLRAPTLRTVGSWIVLFDVVIIFAVLTVAHRVMVRWKNPAAKIAFSFVMIWWASIFIREAAHIFLFLILNGTQPTTM